MLFLVRVAHRRAIKEGELYAINEGLGDESRREEKEDIYIHL